MEEFEDVARQWLEDTECGEFHEDIDDFLFFWHLCNPVHVGVCKEWIFFPFRVVEAQGDIVAELVVAKKEFEVGIECAVVDEVW